jgi:hypothetical protein
MRGISGAACAIFIAAAAGCAQAPPPPAYAAPAEHEALLAYSDALRAALRKPGDPDEAPPAGDEEDYLEAMARGGRIARAERTLSNNETLLKSISTLSRTELSGCAWTRLDLDDATGGADVDSETYPAFAWHCGVRVVHMTAARGQVEAPTEGWFFKEGEAFVYVGKAAHGFKRTADIRKGLA